MIIRKSTPRSFLSIFQQNLRPESHSCPRHLHARTSSAFQPPIPSPTPFVPDASTFLKLIGRNLSQHASKFPTWQSLFSLTSKQLRELGVEPARTRRYLLWWRDRFRKGIFGPGGDLQNVRDGGAEIRVVEIPVSMASASNQMGVSAATGSQRVKKMIVNEPGQAGRGDQSYQDFKPVEGMKVVGARTVVGPYVQGVKGTRGSVATIKVQEGMWEVKRGVKVDGGERRKVQVRRKRLLQERKTSRK